MRVMHDSTARQLYCGTLKLGGRYLRDARDCDSGARLSAAGRALELPETGIRCLSYAVDLSAAERDAEKIIITPALWMWRPRLGRDDQIIAKFALPAAARYFVPWQMLDDSGTATACAPPRKAAWRLPCSANSATYP